MMPSLWDEVPGLVGENTLGVIMFNGKLRDQRSETNAKGAVWINAARRENGTGYDLSMADGNPENSTHIKQVYWLPWKNLSVESVLVRELNLTPCQFFLTSTFSGCRFVVTDTYVAHIANEQPPSMGEARNRQIDRDNAESSLQMPVNDDDAPSVRRKLSISPFPLPPPVKKESKSSGSDSEDEAPVNTGRGRDLIFGWDVIASYQRGAKLGAGMAMVIGYKEGNEWTYKWLKMEGENSASGQWATL
ncbi:hypothetical protein ACO0LO_04375 [Undibacterium sp. TJN25]|uniref:hypothetical protein n=1 Tax=Undibacterium sp. TJN25 TaxID=3413056 RepID=UPI003BF29087